MALILHIDTSGPVGLAMLAQDGKVLSSQYSQEERDHAGSINNLIADVLNDANARIADISGIAVCNGPGSYTGLRIGLAIAKGFCYALDKPLILHNRLHLMLNEVAQAGNCSMNSLALLPARINEFYAAGRGNGVFDFSPRHLMANEVNEMLTNANVGMIIIGVVNEEIHKLINDHKIALIPHSDLNQSMWARVADDDFMSNTFADLAYSEPEYLKGVYFNRPRDSK